MKDAGIGAGSFVHAHTVIGPECVIGTNAIVSAMSVLSHESVIGDCVQFAPGVRVGGGVNIGDQSFFGMGAVVFPKVKVGRNVMVAANSVLNRDVGDNVVVAGTPARVIKTIAKGFLP